MISSSYHFPVYTYTFDMYANLIALNKLRLGRFICAPLPSDIAVTNKIPPYMGIKHLEE